MPNDTWKAVVFPILPKGSELRALPDPDQGTVTISTKAIDTPDMLYVLTPRHALRLCKVIASALGVAVEALGEGQVEDHADS